MFISESQGRENGWEAIFEELLLRFFPNLQDLKPKDLRIATKAQAG